MIFKGVFLLIAILPLVSGQGRRRPKFAPSGPLNGATVDICYDGAVKFVADKENLCWYWECVETSQDGEEINIQLLPRRCALGSKMPYSYEEGLTNPCSINFNTKISFECTRAQDYSVHREPECFKNTVCHNNGNATFEGPVCWCQCPEEWSGNFDCSERKVQTDETTTRANNTECIQREPPCDLVNGCANNGVCHNLCGDFWCECPVPYTNGKRCEGFSCDTNPCLNGGTCNRGAEGIAEVSKCFCPPGFSGNLCEEGQAVVRSPANRAIATAAEQPATQPPTTRPPTTQPPTTRPPTTQPPTTQPPTTRPPTTQPPTTQPPTTQPPTTQPPTTQPPTTQPPTTQPPTTQPPATQPPATQPPATRQPATSQPATRQPATNAPSSGGRRAF